MATDINYLFIPAIIEADGMFKVIDVPIEKPKKLIEILGAMVKDSEKTVLDMQKIFIDAYPNKVYCPVMYPNEYGENGYPDSVIKFGKFYPMCLKEEEYHRKLEEFVKKRVQDYEDRCEKNNLQRHESQVERIESESIANFTLQKKRYFYGMAISWIDAFSFLKTRSDALTNGVEIANKNHMVKMIASEEIGKEEEASEYQINSTTTAAIYTNFGYASSSFFNLSLCYKGIPILTYSDIVTYFFAKKIDIIECTRKYQLLRGSWYEVFDFICNFVNMSIAKPKNFIKTFLLDEANKMIDGLEELSRNPKGFLDKISTVDAKQYEVSYHRMLSKDKRQLELFPLDMPIIFEIEKTTDALIYISNMKQHARDIPELERIITRLYSLNKRLVPKIEEESRNVTAKIAKLSMNLSILNEKRTLIAEELSILDEAIKVKFSEQRTTGENAILDQFKQKFPEYEILQKKKRALDSEISQIYEKICILENFTRKLEDSQKQIEGYTTFIN